MFKEYNQMLLNQTAKSGEILQLYQTAGQNKDISKLRYEYADEMLQQYNSSGQLKSIPLGSTGEVGHS